MPRIHLLPPETARLIAAGEVIDRPAAVLREFLDNAIDSGATEIAAEIMGGGIESIRVVDDGEGMGEEDLALAILPHATSKISRADDLLTARTLGFRGEALASIAAAARLEISSRDGASAEAHRLVTGPGMATMLGAAPGRRGTTVQATRLFEDYPARRQFLKRAQAEASLCRQVFVDKALAHPERSFRFSSEGRLAFAVKPESPEARVLALYDELPRGLTYRVRFSGPACGGHVVLATPGFYRPDRRLMQVFVNRRRVQDPGLLQALDYAFSGFLPGGAHPAAFLFAEVDPAFADFNIHPAKREVRFKDVQGLRHAFVEAVKAFLLELSRREPDKLVGNLGGAGAMAGSFSFGGGEEGQGTTFRGSHPGPMGHVGLPYAERPSTAWEDLGQLRERVAGMAALPGQGSGASGPPRYFGKALGLFLVAEWQGALYLIDQHAAHERIIFDSLMASPPVAQELLVPAVFEAEDDAEEARLEAAAAELKGLGFGLEREGGSWLVTALPSPLDRDPVGAVREILESMSPGGQGSSEAEVTPSFGEGGRQRIRAARSAALATVACRAAVKDGDDLDDAAAAALVEGSLALPEPRCPHGRPVWVKLGREELFRLVRRLV
jgi:DNA mismatch repair protein MutL